MSASETAESVPVLERRLGETGNDALERIADKVIEPIAGKTKRDRHAKLPRQVAAIVYMRMEGMSNAEIAEKMGIKPRRVSEILYQARTRYNFSDILDRVQSQAIPQAIENLNEFLENKDREFTLETLKGTGIFRKHVVGKESSAPNGNTLRVEIALPEGMTMETLPAVAVGNIIATPRRSNALPPPKVETVDAL